MWALHQGNAAVGGLWDDSRMSEALEPAETEPTDTLGAEVSDLRDTPLSELVEDSTPQTERAIDRVLDLEASGLLTLASFNASI